MAQPQHEDWMKTHTEQIVWHPDVQDKINSILDNVTLNAGTPSTVLGERIPPPWLGFLRNSLNGLARDTAQVALGTDPALLPTTPPPPPVWDVDKVREAMGPDHVEIHGGYGSG